MRMSIVMTIEHGTALEIVKLLSNGCLYDGWHRKASDAARARHWRMSGLCLNVYSLFWIFLSNVSPVCGC